MDQFSAEAGNSGLEAASPVVVEEPYIIDLTES
jgi:hypothetical protein